MDERDSFKKIPFIEIIIAFPKEVKYDGKYLEGERIL
jgi:hypothetical protein